MLVIRDAQKHLLEHDALERFERDIVASIRVEFAPKFELMGEPAVRQLIRRAIEAGERMNIRNEGAVAALIELMVQFGERFQHSPERCWAEKILSHPTLPDYVRVDLARQRMMALTQGRTLMPANSQQAAAADGT